ncbi:MAG: FAD:protein FMN transferase [Burkholderiaceae bacterium]|nr:FAD:protein FMN transferase [Burkholderiaceae bacterium]
MSSDLPVFGIEFGAMASRCEVRLAASDEAAARGLALAAIAEVRRIEAKYSRYRADSIVSRINAAAGNEWIACDEETAALFGYADALFDASGGLFDITSGVLRRAWDFRQAQVPEAIILEPLLKLMGWNRMEREREGGALYVRLPQAGMEIDFGGFGKEYAADRAGAILFELGVRHGYVNLGGDMRVIGPQPDGQPWSIAIQDPRRPNAVIAAIPVHSGALATSGDYERYFDLEGRRYCHILDPRNGMPVQYWRSVSVLAPLAIAAGSHATIAMLMQEQGLRFLRESKLAFLAVNQAGEIFQENAV